MKKPQVKHILTALFSTVSILLSVVVYFIWIFIFLDTPDYESNTVSRLGIMIVLLLGLLLIFYSGYLVTQALKKKLYLVAFTSGNLPLLFLVGTAFSVLLFTAYPLLTPILPILFGYVLYRQIVAVKK
jgi:hypothetical protein